MTCSNDCENTSPEIGSSHPGGASNSRRVLNVEGYAVLVLDDGAKTVTLNRELLRSQFGLEE